MATITGSSTASIRRARGRPRRLNLVQVVEAGTELGLEQLSISSIALKLGVSVATIYTYVESLDELRRLVTIALLKTETMNDVGQPWADIVRRQARGAFEILSSEPHLLAQVVAGAIGPESAFREIEAFLTLLGRRGFTNDAAFEIYRSVMWISGGAAIGAAMSLSWKRKGESRPVKLVNALAEAGADEYPLLRKLGPNFFDETLYTDCSFAIEELIERIAASKGELIASPGSAPTVGAD